MKMATYHPHGIFLALLLTCVGFAVAEDPVKFTRSQILADYYLLTWEVDLEARNITFEVKAQTTGYVGFGLNTIGGMKGADIVIGGVFPNGTSYFSDRHGTGNALPVEDKSQDWFLLDAHEANGWTRLKFSRRFISCDREQDLPITKDTIKVIYAVGATDKIAYHQTKRDAKSLLLLSPPPPPVDLSAFQTWNMPVHEDVPAVETTYWVTIHKSPKLTGKAHIVGYKPRLDSAAAIKYTHHLTLHRCRAIEGVNLTQLLEPWVGRPGGRHEDPEMLAIRPHCHNYLYAWAKGGDPLYLPNHVGIPVEETGQQEYFLLEVHYDNPDMDSGVQFETGITIYYTYKLRAHDAGVLAVGTVYTPGAIIPPNVKDFVHVGHCSSECTQAKMPAEGINATSVLLHAHLNARNIRVRHYRGDAELPWLTSDENFDFDYQQDRAIEPEVKIVPGDHLTVECHYNTEWRDPPSAAYGGESNRHEMCTAYILYYPLMKDLGQCSSTYTSLASRLKPLGIDAIDTKSDSEYPLVTAPESMKGLTLMEVLNKRVNWTSDLIERMQYETRWAPQESVCKNYRRPEEGIYKPTSYPNVTSYAPKFMCD